MNKNNFAPLPLTFRKRSFYCRYLAATQPQSAPTQAMALHSIKHLTIMLLLYHKKEL